MPKCEHCVKSVQIQSFFWSVFSRILTEYGEILRITSYSVQMRQNTDRKNSVFGHFSRSGNFIEITLRHGCSPVNLMHILEHLWAAASETGNFL